MSRKSELKKRIFILEVLTFFLARKSSDRSRMEKAFLSPFLSMVLWFVLIS